MPAFSNLLSRGKIYITLVIAAGLAVLGYAINSLIASPVSPNWLILAVLTLLSGAINIKMPGVPARLSFSDAFVFATVLLYGPEAAIIVVTLDQLAMSLRLRDRKALYRAPFNMAASALAIWASARLYRKLLGAVPTGADVSLNQMFVPLMSMALCYFLLNTMLITVAMSLDRGVQAFTLWRNNFLWLSLNYLGGASFAALMVTYRQQFDLAMVGVIVPLLVITFLTFRTTLGRLEDVNRHVTQLNELYLSTIETLAMAVDAKDQITHGHIRRVQVYCIELAKRMGVTEPSQIRAIEAAALLHDMGKLAIPESILNKPGSLTATEFTKMKEHAQIGADLLSAVRFPYPVVPIVRHHHEHWDGRGYPTGISRTDIPLGARILSVVDCFDALTSDRPYRGKMTNKEAFDVLAERRGTMYDPLVVDTFVSCYDEIGPIAIAAGQQAPSLVPAGLFDAVEPPVGPLEQIRANAAETARFHEVSRDLLATSSPSAAFDCVAQYTQQQTPATVCALFRASSTSDTLTCAFASGDNAEVLLGLTIRKGERITGYAAVNNRTICSADPGLDLGNVAASFHGSLKSALVTPLVVEENIVGVLSLYSPGRDAFSSEHQYSVEQIGAPLAARLVQLFPSDTPTLRLF